MNRIEALADALASLCSAHDPDSEAYHARNPILLKAFSPKHDRNANGHRVFKSFIAGYENAILDLKIKCSGQSRAKLTPDSQLIQLLTTYGHQPTAIRYVMKFLRKALRDESLTDGIKLSFFTEVPNGQHPDTPGVAAGHAESDDCARAQSAYPATAPTA